MRSAKRPQPLNQQQTKHFKPAINQKRTVKVPRRPLLFEQASGDMKGRPRQTCAKDASRSGSEPLFEFGDPVNGYKFITTSEQFHMWRKKTVQERPESPPPMSIEIQHLRQYWSEPRGEHLPVEPGDELTKDTVRNFYQRSCRVLAADMKTLLKAERIRWHPDKSSRQDATQVFQIINDLWESLQSI